MPTLLLHPRLPTCPLHAVSHHHHGVSSGLHPLPLPDLLGSGLRAARKHTPITVACRAARAKEPPSTGTAPAAALAKEAHKYFDHAVVSVRAGDGGHGAVLAMPPAPSTDAPKSRGRFDKSKRSSSSNKVSYRRNYDGSVALPMGGHGSGAACGGWSGVQWRITR